ncbi:type-F conjugative transfer system protein TraW [Pantoea cypripedii]|uniref:Type-F conjugative transfer system protein TraW n=1 Tax=Pantoea cypripedii TaxID=55209 RepID=A0A6B9G766_PANCY|nr:type-F conjugative transfer system protein TraW [Pantoea cypripedii]QGY32532.1 type-F conjugative transfer system protein TraW [Pantoea cypripedii]
MKSLLTGLVLAAFSWPLAAADLGTWGDTWDIREHNLITVLQNNLQQHFAGQTQADTEQALRDQVEALVMRPPPVDGLVTGRETHIRLYDPAFTVAQDLSDQQGNVFARRGERISPFDVIPVFDETLYFIDGDDVRQVAWMRQQRPLTTSRRIILVNGNVRDSASALGDRVYFDQSGSLVRKFGIRQIPAEVKQVPGKRVFSITEYGLPEE